MRIFQKSESGKGSSMVLPNWILRNLLNLQYSCPLSWPTSAFLLAPGDRAGWGNWNLQDSLLFHPSLGPQDQVAHSQVPGTPFSLCSPTQITFSVLSPGGLTTHSGCLEMNLSPSSPPFLASAPSNCKNTLASLYHLEFVLEI